MRPSPALSAALLCFSAMSAAGCCGLMPGGCTDTQAGTDHDDVMRQRSAYDRSRGYDDGPLDPQDEGGPGRRRPRAGRDGSREADPQSEPRTDRRPAREPPPSPDEPTPERPFTPGSSSNK
jgi:hypothetical protein